MDIECSKSLNNVMELSMSSAKLRGDHFIQPEDLLFGILNDSEGEAFKILSKVGLDVENVKALLQKSLLRLRESNKGDIIHSVSKIKNVHLSRYSEFIFREASFQAKNQHDKIVGSEHLLLALLTDKNNSACKILLEEGVDYQKIENNLRGPIQFHAPSDSNTKKLQPNYQQSSTCLTLI